MEGSGFLQARQATEGEEEPDLVLLHLPYTFAIDHCLRFQGKSGVRKVVGASDRYLKLWIDEIALIRMRDDALAYLTPGAPYAEVCPWMREAAQRLVGHCKKVARENNDGALPEWLIAAWSDGA